MKNKKKKIIFLLSIVVIIIVSVVVLNEVFKDDNKDVKIIELEDFENGSENEFDY